MAGAFYHSVALPENVLQHLWDKDSPPLDAGNWGTFAGTKTTQDEFRALPDGGWARASMKAPDGKFTWTRAVSLARLAEDLPVIAIQDSYAGDGAVGAKVFTLNLMADGPMETPAGNRTPPQRIWGYESHFGDRKELASAGQVVRLKPGVSRLGFTGQKWKAHPTQGIDFRVYVVADEEQEAHVGNWAHAWGGTSSSEFRAANGHPFEERQHILPLRSRGGFRVFIVAHPKGRDPGDIQVQRDGTQVVISARAPSPGWSRTVRFDADGRILPDKSPAPGGPATTSGALVKYAPRRGDAGPRFRHELVLTPDGVLCTLTRTGGTERWGVTLPLPEDDRVVTSAGQSQRRQSPSSNVT